MASQISKAVHVTRIHTTSFRSGGRWIHVPVSRRVREQRQATKRWLHRPSSWPKPWQPDHGRESPREELMADRRSRVRYAFPGWMQFYHGKAPPLVGRSLLYDPFAPEATRKKLGYDQKAD